MRLRFPKPPAREPKPPKRLVRNSSPIGRKTRPNRQRKTSRGKMGRLADKLFSLIVRHPGKCVYHAAPTVDSGAEACGGSLQCAHIVSRIYRSVRWDEQNAMPLCAGAHRYFTGRALEWERFVTLCMGAADYEALKIRALKPWDRDLEGVLVRLASRAVALGIKA